MKLDLLALFFFFFGFAAAGIVYDTDGKPVLNNAGQYYIFPALRGKGGGLGLANDNDGNCPLTVSQTPYLPIGLPVRFSSQALILAITTTLYLNIEFTRAPSCAPKPARWTVDFDEYSSEKGYTPVKISDDTRIKYPFQIREYGDDYKLVYCTESDSKEGKCLDLGIKIYNEKNRLLVLKDGDPFIVKFKKVDKESSEEWSIV